MIEIPVVFGSESSLVGVVTKPARVLHHGIACLTFNAGVIPRLGPHRFNVKLARGLANTGVTSMRFDISGLGDSRPAAAERNFLKQSVSDIRAAMDFLEARHGIRRFVLVGNCSGAVQAYWTAIEDALVAGILMFDGYSYHSRWSRPIRLWKRFRAMGWQHALEAVSRRFSAAAKSVASRSSESVQVVSEVDDSGTRQSLSDYCRHMQLLADRGVKVLSVYSGGIIEYYSYTNQYRHVFGRQPFFDKVKWQFMPDIDHTLLTLDSQRRFIDLIVGWLESDFALTRTN